MIIFRYFSIILIGASFLSACEKINETNIAEYKALCSEYGHAQTSSQFSKCVKRQKNFFVHSPLLQIQAK